VVEMDKQESSPAASLAGRAAPLVRLGAPCVWIGDSGALMKDVCQGLRGARMTSLLAALHHDAARLFVAGHVLEEVKRHLARVAAESTVDGVAALDRWNRVYLPYIRVVNVPEWWGQEHIEAQKVGARDPDDQPTARLAAALAPCYVIAEDHDLTDYGFGGRDWLQVTHASANQAYIEWGASAVYLPSRVGIELARGAGQLLGRLPAETKLLLLWVIFGAAVWLQRDTQAVRHLDRLLGKAAELARRVGPPLAQVATDRRQAMESWDRHAVVASQARPLDEEVARLLAVAPDPLLAVELAHQVGAEGTLHERTTAVRGLLIATPAFVQVRPSRWELGVPATVGRPILTVQEVIDWVRRVTSPRVTTSGSTRGKVD